MCRILIIDDDATMCNLLREVITRMGHQAHTSHTIRRGMQSVAKGGFEIILLDLTLPDGNGLDALPRIKESPSQPEVIILTGNQSPDAAETAITNGAWDYLVKPSSVDNIRLAVKRALAFRDEKRRNPLPKVLKRDAIIGESPFLQTALERVAQAATVDSNVLISGDTGTGKELFARAIHENSNRAGHPFVVVDCAALPESLVESVLFGHAKGAFTGAEKARTGLILQAHGGTLFLDEVGEMPMAIQKSFLRVIQERVFRPVSSRKEVRVNFRLIAATNRDLENHAEQGFFRPDLLFRLRSINLNVPPLEQRKSDIRSLVRYHLNRMCERYRMEAKGYTENFMAALERHHWPGNIRELFNTLEECLARAAGEPTLKVHHLPTRVRAFIARHKVKNWSRGCETGRVVTVSDNGGEQLMQLQAFRNVMEYRYLQRLNEITGGNRKEACRLSGLSRTRLYELLKKHELNNHHAPQKGRHRSRLLCC